MYPTRNCTWQLVLLLPNAPCIDCVIPLAALDAVNVTAVSHFTCFTLSAGLRCNKMNTSSSGRGIEPLCRSVIYIQVRRLICSERAVVPQRITAAWERGDRELPELRRYPFSQACTAHGVTVSELGIFQEVFARARVCACVCVCEKRWGRWGLMPCCQRSPHDEVVKAQGDGEKKKHNARNTEIEQKISE